MPIIPGDIGRLEALPSVNSEDRVPVYAQNGRAYSASVSSLQGSLFTSLVVVSSLSDLPSPAGGVITLEDNVAYLIDGNIGIGDNRIVCGDNNAILGYSPEVSVLHNTLDGEALITAAQTVNCYTVTFYTSGSGSQILDLDASTSPDANNALDWRDVNFSGGDIGVISNYSNAVFANIGIIDKTDEGFPSLGSGFVFDGDIGSIVFERSLFTVSGSGNVGVTLSSTLTLSRRFRATNSAFVVLSGATGLEFVSGASAASEGVVLNNVNFSGGATYLSGIDYTNDIARFEGCRGVTNTYAAAYYTMTGNSVETVISSTGVPVKVAGTTTGESVTQKFDVSTTDNRATYNGALTRLAKITVVATLSSANNNQVGVYVAKNGSVIDASETYLTTNSAGRLENGTCQAISTLEGGDYFEVWVENNSSTSNVTVEDLSLIITEV